MFKKTLITLSVAILAVATVPLFIGCQSGKSTTYEIECEFDGKTVSGTEKVVFYNDTDNTFSELKFNLFANAFRKNAKFSPVSAQYHYQAYKWGENYGGIEISGVRIGGQASDFTIGGEDENILIVPLKSEVFPNEKVAAEIDFKTDLAKVVARTGINADTINLANFYPVLCGIEDGAFYECVYYANGDPFFSNIADYTVKFTRDKNLIAAASGELVSERETGDKITSTYRIQSARSFALALSEKFSVMQEKVGETDVLYYYYNDMDAENSLATAVKALNFFGEMWGEYPYKTYSVVQTPFVQGGMEFTALTYISADLEPAAYKEVIVHETAHQWWYNLVGNSEFDYAWLDEGLTEYSTALFYEINDDYEIKKSDLINNAYSNYQLFLEVYGTVYGNVDTSMNRSLNEFNTEPEYVYVTYVKGMLLFDTLRELLGSQKFEKCLKKYFEENKYKISKPENLISSFEKASKTKLETLFNAWIDGKVILLK